MLKCEGVLIYGFKHMSLNARKYGNTSKVNRMAGPAQFAHQSHPQCLKLEK